MQGKWGIAWLAAIIVLVSLTCAPLPGLAADSWDRGGMPLILAGAQTPMEAQMLGEKPFQSRPAPINPGAGFLSNLASGRAPNPMEARCWAKNPSSPVPLPLTLAPASYPPSLPVCNWTRMAGLL